MKTFLLKYQNTKKKIEANSKEEACFEFMKSIGYSIEEEKEEAKTIPLEYYWQRHKRYKNLKLGFSNLSFQNNGCFTCCLAFLVKKDPLEVHELLKKEKCYNKALIISDKTAKVLGLTLEKGNSNIAGKHTNPYLAPQFETIKEVLLEGNQHFVVRLIEGNKKSIFDPWTGKVLPLNHYEFVSFRLFRCSK